VALPPAIEFDACGVLPKKTNRRREMNHRCTVSILFVVTLLTNAALAQTPPVTKKQVDVFGQRINYLEAGSGPAVILLHGLGGDSTNWAATVPALAEKFKVYVPDQIGFGESAKPLMNYRVSTLVDFLNEFFVKAGITRASLVGNSLGGWTSAAFALAHPEKVERLVLVDAAGYSPSRTGTKTLSRDEMLQLNPSTLAGVRTLMSVVIYNKQMLTDQFIAQAFAGRMAKNDGYTVNMFIDSILRGEDILDGKLGAIKAPTLIVWGREDLLTPLTMGKALAEDIRGSELFVIDKCGHVPQIESPVAFNQKVIAFLSTAQGAAASSK
jgi:2-hydroxy-6-oxonona-2,4-dienedioate hydrolase